MTDRYAAKIWLPVVVGSVAIAAWLSDPAPSRRELIFGLGWLAITIVAFWDRKRKLPELR